MDRKTALPLYPDAPEIYNRRWASDLIRALDQLNVLLRNPGEGRFTNVTFTDLPTSDSGLEPGAVFRSGNQLLIVVQDRAYASSFPVTARLGTVTVTTT